MKISKLICSLLLAGSLFAGSAEAAVVETPAGAEMSRPEISVLLPGYAKDNGFMEAGYRDYQKIAENVTAQVKCMYDVSATSDKVLLTEALRQLAQEGPQLIIAHGGQCNAPVAAVSKEFPAIKFVVIQGNIKSDNVSSYKVDQE